MALTLPLTGNIVGDEATQGGIIYRWNGVAWVALHLIKTSGMNTLSDVDTSTTAPDSDQILIWDGNNWVPGDPGAGMIISDTEPTELVDGLLWLDTVNGGTYTWYEAGSTWIGV